MIKIDKKKKNTVQEVSLDDINVEIEADVPESKKKGKEKIFYPLPEMEEEDPHDWKVPIKKVMGDDEDESLDHDDRQILEQIEEEEELLFREK